MYMRKHHKEESLVRGNNLEWKDTFSIDDRGMIPRGAMVTEMQRTEAQFYGEHE